MNAWTTLIPDIIMLNQYCINKTTKFSILMLAIFTVFTDNTQTEEVAHVGIIRS